MTAKRKSAATSNGPPAVPDLADGLELALAPVATAMGEELAGLLAAVLDGRKLKTRDRLADSLIKNLLQSFTFAIQACGRA